MYEYSGIGYDLQFIRLGLDGCQYLLTGRCYCLVGGAAAIWVNMMTKLLYYRLPFFMDKRGYLIPIGCFYVACAVMVVWRARVDLLLALVLAVIEVMYMGGGTIKYPKHVFQQKENWVAMIRVDSCSVWQSFRWNDYRENQYLCLDNDQLYVTRKERLTWIGGIR